MSTSKATYKSEDELSQKIGAAQGSVMADLVVKNVQFLDVFSGCFRKGDVAVLNDTIVGIMECYKGHREVDGDGFFLVPGFIDSHVHIESSMMTPVRFQEAVLPCGTTAVIWDPHEIANVKGTSGIDWALDSSESLELDVFVMVPSCVPSTSSELNLETSGASLYSKDLVRFKNHPRVLGLAEMMNFPGLLFSDPEVLAKIQDFNTLKRDGHCPGLSGKALNAYGVAGIHSCHESTTRGEAEEKLSKGIHVLIREGSCAKNAETLLPMINAYTSATLGMCSDDRNPLDIEAEGHIDCIVNKALAMGIPPEQCFRVASYAAAQLYGLADRGAIAPGYLADFVLIQKNDNSWNNGFSISKVFKSGLEVDKVRLSQQKTKKSFQELNLKLPKPTEQNLRVSVTQNVEKAKCRVIGVKPNQILTDSLVRELKVTSGCATEDLTQDVLKIGVFERHHNTGRHSVGFVHGFNLKTGAIATSINHDCHNIIAVGANDVAILEAVHALIRIDGGIVVSDAKGGIYSLSLPIGGLMTDDAPHLVSEKLKVLKKMTRENGCLLDEPFLTLSFLALPVIPSLKITDQGLVDVNDFKRVDVLL